MAAGKSQMKSKPFYFAVVFVVIICAAIFFLGPRSFGRSDEWSDAPDRPWDLSAFQRWEITDQKTGPVLSAGDHVEPAEGRRIVTLQRRRLTQKLVAHFPYGSYAKKSLPCVLVPSGGGNLITGTPPAANRDVMKPILSEGMVVISYELSGSISPWDAGDEKLLSDAYRQFVDVRAGLVNSLNAFEYAINDIDVVDPAKVFVAGYSSGGTHALLLAAHEPRLAGCIAWCPDPDLADFDQETTEALQFLYAIKQFVKKAAPLTHVQKVKCPVFIFAVQDDEIIEFENVNSYVKALRKTNPDVVFRWADSGGHAIPYLNQGRAMGVKWITRIVAR